LHSLSPTSTQSEERTNGSVETNLNAVTPVVTNTIMPSTSQPILSSNMVSMFLTLLPNSDVLNNSNPPLSNHDIQIHASSRRSSKAIINRKRKHIVRKKNRRKSGQGRYQTFEKERTFSQHRHGNKKNRRKRGIRGRKRVHGHNLL